MSYSLLPDGSLRVGPRGDKSLDARDPMLPKVPWRAQRPALSTVPGTVVTSKDSNLDQEEHQLQTESILQQLRGRVKTMQAGVGDVCIRRNVSCEPLTHVLGSNDLVLSYSSNIPISAYTLRRTWVRYGCRSLSRTILCHFSQCVATVSSLVNGEMK